MIKKEPSKEEIDDKLEKEIEDELNVNEEKIFRKTKTEIDDHNNNEDELNVTKEKSSGKQNPNKNRN